jgi:hypothetical protein
MRSLSYRIIERVKDPAVRYRYHIYATVFWVVMFFVMPFLPCFWGTSNLAALLIMEVSIYANASTEFGAIDSSKASDSTEDIEASLKTRKR